MTSGISGVTTVARGAPNDVRSGAQVRLRAQFQRVQLPAQLSNSIGSATQLNEPLPQSPCEPETVNVASSLFAHDEFVDRPPSCYSGGAQQTYCAPLFGSPATLFSGSISS